MTIQPGSITSFQSVDLYAKVSGFLKTQTVDIGSPIHRGQLLAEIDAPELQTEVEEAEATLDEARSTAEQATAHVATARANRTAEQASVAEAEADIARLTATYSLTQKKYDRIKFLRSRDALPDQIVDEHQHERESAEAAKRTGEAAVETARARLATADARIVQAEADLKRARAGIRVAEKRLAKARVFAEYMRITAPFDGVVTDRTFHPGAFVRSAADGTPKPLLRVVRTDLMRVVVQVPDLDVPLLDVGDRVTVEVDALKHKELAGAIARFGKSEDPTTRTMRAEIDLPNPDGRLVEGMYGRATIHLQPASGNLTIPPGCVVGHSAGASSAVFVVRDGIARRVPVTLGAEDGKAIEVLTGLTSSDDVIIRPNSLLADGTRVDTTPETVANAAKH